MSDEIHNLILQAQDDDIAAQGQLYDYYYPKISGFVFRRTQNKQNTQDIVSEIFIKVLKNIKKVKLYNGSKSFNAWIFRVAVNEINQFYRYKWIKNHIPILSDTVLRDESNQDEIEEIEKSINKSDISGIIIKAVSQLKKKYQTIIHLRYFEKMGFKMIAETLGKNPSSARVQSHRAIKKLKEILESEGHNIDNLNL